MFFKKQIQQLKERLKDKFIELDKKIEALRQKEIQMEEIHKASCIRFEAILKNKVDIYEKPQFTKNQVVKTGICIISFSSSKVNEYERDGIVISDRQEDYTYQVLVFETQKIEAIPELTLVASNKKEK